MLSDDGLMIHEALACELPIIALLRVKYGRYHNMEGIFPGAVLECDLNELKGQIEFVLENKDEIKEKSKNYARLILDAPPKNGKHNKRQNTVEMNSTISIYPNVLFNDPNKVCRPLFHF